MRSSVADAGLARRIYERAHLSGEFRLSSGVVSGEYFDKYLFESDPALLREVAEALVDLLRDDPLPRRLRPAGTSRIDPASRSSRRGAGMMRAEPDRLSLLDRPRR